MVGTNDLKSGDRVLLACGWHATIADNRRGNIRTAEVYGYHTETGSVYAWDIVHRENVDGTVDEIVLTDKQRKDRARCRAFGF